ncbi:MAG: carboxypeptidase regulatory-like domain-containing protein [Deltaproteobacteria bacterium]|nr:carboxypeptidase regulatory-like domain-containing protein [Deltaproteobacteria bacterium]
MNRRFSSLVVPALIVAVTLALGAYQGAVAAGGTISGAVMFKGDVPKPKKLKVTKDKKRCDKSPKFDESLVVKDGKLANVVVYIAEVKGGKKLEKKGVTLDQNGCLYQPHVLAVDAGADVTILNPDKVLHNIHTYSKINKPMNRAQPKFKKKLKVKFDKPEIMEVKCDVHGWMGGWIFVAGNPYYSVTGEDGAFSLTDLPAGKYQVQIWHEKLGTQTKEVEVKDGETAKLDVEFAG